MIKLIIFADDLTGALDTGAQFAKGGIATKVTLADDISAQDLSDARLEVLAVDTDSRHDSAEHAYQKLFRLTKEAMAYGVPHIYKKTDSALRGNVGAELAAVWNAAGIKQISFIPAYPDNHCVTVDGCQMIDGMFLDQTKVGADAFNAVTHSRVKHIIRQQYDVPVEEAAAARPVSPLFSGVVVYDAASNADLSAIGKGLQQNGMLQLCAGCAGFAGVLPELIAFSQTPAENEEPPMQHVLVVSGSLNVNSIRQLDHLRRKGYAVVTLADVLDLALGRLPADTIRSVADTIGRTVEKDGLAAVESVNEKTAASIFPQNREAVTAHIAGIVKRVMAQYPVDTLVVFGGDTCRGILQAMDCTSLTPRRELLPGVVKAAARINGREITLISKAGRFGGEDALEAVLPLRAR